MSAATLLNTTIGAYRLVEFLGAGGMGEVYRAIDGRTGHVAAVKVLSLDGLTSTARQRFYNEAHVQAGMRHPNIAQLFEFLDAGGRPCLAMEFVEGETLADRLAREGRLDVAAAIGIFLDLVAAVAYVHAQGIVHRDIKPTNVRVTPGGTVKLLDFGIAKNVATRGLTQTGNVVGTPHYLSPEQLQGRDATPRSDIWSLGVLLYEMLAGRVPYEAATITELWDLVNAGRYRSVSALPATQGVDRAALRRIDRVLARCLRKDPDQRFASAEELLTAASLAAGSARRSAPGAVVRWLERSWWWLGAAAFVLVIVALFVPWRQDKSPPRDLGPANQTLSTVEVDVLQGRADVYVNGEHVGQTPYELRGAFGSSVDLELRQPGFEPIRTRVDITQQRALTLRMERQARGAAQR